MENKYSKQLLNEFHKNNKFRTYNWAVASSNLSYIILNKDESYDSSTEHIYDKTLYPGAYKVIIDNVDYLFILYTFLNDGDKLIFKNKRLYYYNSYTDDTKLMKLYRCNIDNVPILNEYEIDSINTPIDSFVFYGKTKLSSDEVSFNNPRKVESIDFIELKTTLIDDKLIIPHDNNLLDLKNNIKSLPNGIRDMLVIDSFKESAFAVFNVGRYIVTGNEEWEFVESMSNLVSYVYHINYDLITKYSIATNLVCSHCNTYTFQELSNKNFTKEGICIDPNNNGIYVRVPKELCKEPDDISFKTYLRTIYKTSDPFIIEYLLDEPITKSILLDEYHLKTAFPRTKFNINIDSDYVMCMKRM